MFVAVIVFNYLAVSLPIGGYTTGELADMYTNLFVPAGITFSIWGLIYLLVGWFVVWQIVDLYKKQSQAITKKIWIWFLLSCLANIWWIFAWHYQKVLLSVVIMLVFLFVLIMIVKKLEVIKKLWTWKEKLFVKVPFSVYLWWISVATIANITALLVDIGWNMWWMSDIFWTILLIVIATFLALWSLYKKYDIVYALVIIWALVGIIIKRVSVDPIYTVDIIWTLGVCIVVIATWIWLRFDKWKKLY